MISISSRFATPDRRESHAQAGTDRSAHPQRNWQCVFRRDSSCRATLSGRSNAQTEAGRMPAPVCRHSRTLQKWIDRLGKEIETAFPEKVTAFRKNMAVHGRYGEPCTRCGEKIQRIRYADNETNYCARCQTGGKVLADRSLSRLLGSDWPRTLDELEALKRR